MAPSRGQTTCYEAGVAVTACGTGIGLGQDGDLQLGVAWPNPRFTKNGDGTVTDELTGLVWLENANCFGQQDWTNALAKSNALFDGCTDCGGTDNDCGLTDGSVQGEWRLGNVLELYSLVSYGFHDPAVPNTAGTGQGSKGDPFLGVQSSGYYWTSTTVADPMIRAKVVKMDLGYIGSYVKSTPWWVWPVRGGD